MGHNERCRDKVKTSQLSGGHVGWRWDWWSLCVKVVKIESLNIYNFSIDENAFDLQFFH